MQFSSGRLTLAATDLGRFLACRHLTGLDVEVALGKRKKPPKYPDPFLELLINRGLAHEKDYTGKIEKGGATVLDLTEFGGADAVSRTIEAMKAGKPAIAQGALAADGWFGRPDFLQSVDKPSSLGPFSYEAIDTKLTRETRGSTILQLSFYSELLGVAQGVQPEFFHVVTPIASEKYRVSDFAAYYRLVKRRLVEAAGGDITALLAANYPEPTDHCEVCRWWQQCDSRRRADDHLSLVAGINRNSSDEEVAVVRDLVATLLKKGSRWTNEKGETKQVTQDDILVVAPFNAQVNRLQDALNSSGIRVGTVDRFQGQESAVVIYSMATSRPEDAPRELESLLKRALDDAERVKAGRALHELERAGLVQPTYRDLSQPEQWLEITPAGQRALERGALDELDEALFAFDRRFVDLREGAWAALESEQPDSFRQAAHSGRELIEQVLHKIAPDDEMKAEAGFKPNPEARSGITRSMRLKYGQRVGRIRSSESNLRVAEAAERLVIEIDNRLMALAHSRELVLKADVRDALVVAEIVLRRLLLSTVDEERGDGLPAG